MINNKITALMLALTISAGGIFAADVYASTDPEAPSNITVTAGDGSVTLDWDPVEGAVGYRIYRNNNDEGNRYISVMTVEDDKAVIPGLTNGSTYRFKIATLAKAKKGSTISAVSDAVSVTPLEGSEDTKESLKIKKEPAENIPSLSSEEKRTKSKEEKKSKPAPEIEDMTSSYTLKGVGLSELGKLAFTSFDNFRTKLVVKGYTIRVKSYKADVGKYKATYEVSWEGVPMYILTEKYEANLEDGAQNDSTKMTGEVSMELVEIEN